MATGETYQVWNVEEPYLNLHSKLGEGPYYEKATNTLRWVDIIGQRVHTVSLTEGPSSVKTLQLDTPVTVTADVEGYDPQDKILIGVKYGIALLDRKTGKYEYVAKFAGADGEENSRLRSNDGGVDPHGRFWMGAMTDFGQGDFQPEGGIYLFKGEQTKKVVPDLTIPNTISWSPDNKTSYYTHSSARTIFAHDYNLSDGSVSGHRVFYSHDGPGEPDGHRVDVDGNIWHAVYGESRVVKITPDGKVTGQINLPTKNITCCQFVGTELFITTANDDSGEGKSKELGGALFRVDVGTTGLEPFKFKLSP
ncbi:Putative sugar lactone lactonase [Cytospora mali]|uniref:Sugar lactone lactonase n=1 Tax=Cytospora mali TaxID=578113 RepID=A0A194V603_CYTMA|nr:Putative sugar lactone lactonase [Valsa mali var. pyri (nom. inval.)]